MSDEPEVAHTCPGCGKPFELVHERYPRHERAVSKGGATVYGLCPWSEVPFDMQPGARFAIVGPGDALTVTVQMNKSTCDLLLQEIAELNTPLFAASPLRELAEVLTRQRAYQKRAYGEDT